MTEYKNNLHKYAMHYGTYMGIYWILIFTLLPLIFQNHLLFPLFLILNLVVPFLGYYYARTYRNRFCHGSISFTQAWLFTLFMYIFASILMGAAYYIYFRYIDNGFIYSSYNEILTGLRNKNIPQTDDLISQLQNIIDYTASLRPIQLTMQWISQNIFYCNILSIFTALAVMRRPKNQPADNNDSQIN